MASLSVTSLPPSSNTISSSNVRAQPSAILLAHNAKLAPRFAGPIFAAGVWIRNKLLGQIAGPESIMANGNAVVGDGQPSLRPAQVFGHRDNVVGLVRIVIELHGHNLCRCPIPIPIPTCTL